MPVSKRIVGSCPFLLESDVLSLSKGFVKRGASLHDVPIGARHTIQDAGEHIISSLARSCRLAGLYAVANRHHVSDQNVHELLGLLNLLGALQRKRTTGQHLTALARQSLHVSLGITYAALTWRRHASAAALCIAIVRAAGLVIVASVLVCGLVAGSGLYPAVQAVAITTLALGLFVLSLLAHEMAHIHCIRKHHPTPVVLQRGMRLGIIHPALPRHAEITTALAGPAVGIGLCGAVASLCLLLQQPAMAITGCIVGLFHLGSLLPRYSDGATIRKALRGY